jgi:hypothetical protein
MFADRILKLGECSLFSKLCCIHWQILAKKCLLLNELKHEWIIFPSPFQSYRLLVASRLCWLPHSPYATPVKEKR